MSNNKVAATYHEGEYRNCHVEDCEKTVYWERVGAGSWKLSHVDGSEEHSGYVDCPKTKKWWEFWK